MVSRMPHGRSRRVAITVLPAAMALAACGGRSGTGTAPSQTSAGDESEAAVAPRVPAGYTRARVVGVLPAMGGHAVVLADARRRRVLPIAIGGSVAFAIDLRLRGRDFERPLTHDLLDQIIDRIGGELLMVQVDRLRGDVFIGTVVLRADNELHEIDARPSDAIALAVGNDVPIYVNEVVLERAGMSVERLPGHPGKPGRAPGGAGESPPAPRPVTPRPLPKRPKSL